MLVGERMAHPVITVSPESLVIEVLELMKKHHIRRTPVTKDGKLVGIISDKDILNASPSPTTALSVWEMNYLLSKIRIRDVMSQKVLTVNEDTPIEEAAKIMSDNKIGGLPVMNGDKIVGIITETDLFKALLGLMGAREHGVRVTAQISDAKGTLARLTETLAGAGANFIAFGQTSGTDATNRQITFKVSDIDEERLVELLEPLVERIIDIRVSGG
jgi:acetoin utilization protein AcuB